MTGGNFGDGGPDPNRIGTVVNTSIVFSGGPDLNRIGWQPSSIGQSRPPSMFTAGQSRPQSAVNENMQNQMHRIPFSMFPDYARTKLAAFDTDGDESLDIDEILAGCDALAREKQRSQNLKWIVAGLICLILLLLAAIGVMMFVIVQAAKDTGMAGNTLTVKGTNNTVQTASSDFYVENGVMKSRSDSSNRRCARRASNGSCPTESALMTSQATFESPISSQMDDADLIELKQLTISQEGSWIHFQIFAVARYVDEESRYGSVVVLYTHVGELTIDGEAIFFTERIAGAFSRAGFMVDPKNGRRLLGVVEMLGLFNSLRRAVESDPDSALAEAVNAIPLRFYAEVTEFKKCDLGPDCFLPGGRMVDHAELMYVVPSSCFVFLACDLVAGHDLSVLILLRAQAGRERSLCCRQYRAAIFPGSEWRTSLQDTSHNTSISRANLHQTSKLHTSSRIPILQGHRLLLSTLGG